MPHDTPLIATIAVGLGFAFALGLLAQRLKLPPIAGYIAAGILIGPFTPGFIADQKLADELAGIGIILLMFGVGLNFSVHELLAVRGVVIPGAIMQIAVTTSFGWILAGWLGWPVGARVMFGLALSVASTVVLLRALRERRQIETERGRLAVGWLIVEDLAMALALVLAPPLAGLLGGLPQAGAKGGFALAFGLEPISATLIVTATKLCVFLALMLVVGRKLIPWLLHFVAHTGSRELFRLSVLVIALGVAYGSAMLFGVSFALGAFFGGMVLAESQLSQQAARETLPLRDAFAVLFFVSVGMLFDPTIIVREPLAVAATVFIIVAGKSLASYLIVRLFGGSHAIALSMAASLAQIGEFSFILIVLSVDLGIVTATARDLVVAGSIVSILINPLAFRVLDRLLAKEAAHAPAAPAPAPPPEPQEEPATALTGHAVLVGHGRVGAAVAAELVALKIPFLVVDAEESALAPLAQKGIETFAGAAGEPSMLARLNLPGARFLITAIPDPYEAGHLVEAAKAANPGIRVIARAHSEEAVAFLRQVGADVVLMGETELARAMVRAFTDSPGSDVRR